MGCIPDDDLKHYDACTVDSRVDTTVKESYIIAEVEVIEWQNANGSICKSNGKRYSSAITMLARLAAGQSTDWERHSSRIELAKE
ncbi:MAG: hypothetical protein BWY95_02582 [Bacteroidetes bacterium ADurb.BinA104]|nr:MAG: hypothetical protein BWY95_02582 [Bacteroidetes bacterium ADurb.BinA104]